MIAYLDQIVDTKEKRYYCFLCITFGLLLWIVVQYFLLANQLIQLHSYADLFAMWQDPSLQNTLVSRVIANAMSLPSFQPIKLIQIIITNVRWYELVCVMGFLLLVFDTSKLYRKLTIGLFLFICSGAIVISLFAYTGLQAGSLNEATSQLFMIGVVMMVMALILFMLCMYVFIQHIIPNYCKALQYTCEEI